MTETPKSGWGQRLRNVREAKGHSRSVWTALVGGGKTAWFDYENEKSSPDLEMLIRVKEMTGIDLNWLATGEEQPINLDMLRDVIQAVQEETPDIDAASKARLISRLYSDRINVHSIGIEAAPSRKGKGASSS